MTRTMTTANTFMERVMSRSIAAILAFVMALFAMAAVPANAQQHRVIVKICKVAGPGVAVGTPFTFTVGSHTLTVAAGTAPFGNCGEVTDSKAFIPGANVTVTETVPSGVSVSSIVVNPASELVGSPNLGAGSVTVHLDTGVTEITYTNSHPIDPPPPPKGCLKDIKYSVKCNGDGTFTVTLGNIGNPGDVITLGSATPGMTVSPPTQNWAPTTTWTITGATSGQTVTLSANDTKVGGGEKPGTDQCCSGEIKIVMPDCPKKPNGEVVVEKKVQNHTRASAAVINSLVFPIGLSCTAPSNLSVSFGLSNGGSHTENNVPYTSVCTVTEATSTLPPPPLDVCGQGSVAVWGLPVITPASATINAPVTAFTVVNELHCEHVDVKTGVLLVEKKVQNKTEGNLTGWTYPITSTCGTPSSFNLPDGGVQTLNNIPIGTSCSISENTSSLPVPARACPGGRSHPVWSTTYVPATATIGSSPVTLTAVNTLTCEPDKPLCTPPMVPNVDGICACPPPMVPGAILGQCICPPGTMLEGKECVRIPPPPPVCPPGMVLRGKECVKIAPPLACKSPLVPNAARTSCVCSNGRVMRHGKCVQPVVCHSPAKLNRRGTGCDCPRDMEKKGNTCVERRRPRVTPNDVIRVIPGFIGPRGHNGDGGGPSPRGGGAVPGKP